MRWPRTIPVDAGAEGAPQTSPLLLPDHFGQEGALSRLSSAFSATTHDQGGHKGQEDDQQDAGDEVVGP